MKQENFNALRDELLTSLDNQGRVSEIVAELTTNNEEIEKSNAELTSSIESIKQDNENLRNANNKILNQLGAQDLNFNKPPSNEGGEEEGESEGEQLKFEDLFNEKGELK